jgi:mono/diheme cytochrome c family protein
MTNISVLKRRNNMTKVMWQLCLAAVAAGALMGAGDPAAGKAVYDKACKSCHGANGTPNAAIAKSMKVDMAPLGDPAVQKLSDDELKAAITNGKGKMKPIKSVSGKAVDDVVAYMRTFKK